MIYVNEKYCFLLCLTAKCGSTSGIRWLLDMEDHIKNDISHKHGLTSQDWWVCSKHQNIWYCAGRNLKRLRDYPPNSKVLLKNYCESVLRKIPLKRFEKWQGFSPLLKSNKYLLKNYYKIVFVRNPWRRLVSTYLEKFCTGDYLKIEQAKYAAKWIYDKYGLANGARDDYENGGGITFDQFLDFVGSHPDEMLEEHWRPQYLSLEGINYDSVIKIENIKHDICYVKKRLGIEEDFPRIRSSNIIYRRMDGYYHNSWPADLIKQRRNYGYLPSYQSFYTNDLVEKVARKYKKDIELFGYKYDE